MASVAITPQEPMWLAGWAARRAPASGTALELRAKALALEDANGGRVVVVTADLIAIPREIAEAVAEHVQQRCGIPRERILFNASHTHTGPEIRPDKVPFFEIPPEFAAKIPSYVAQLTGRIADVITAAVNKLEPASLHAESRRATFAANRRNAAGPVDHDVPLLTARRPDGTVLAILFGYACHNLTLPASYCEYHGDYAGVAQVEIETEFGGATALFLAGAGADLDPAPRGGIEWALEHGRALAAAVAGGVRAPSRPIAPELAVTFEDVTLDLSPIPSTAELEADTRSDDPPRRRKAVYLLARHAENRPLPTTLRCPVQVIRFGREWLLVALGGEPVVDYARRFKAEFRGPGVWVAGYANDMFGYLPTRAVQQEGGYEGGRASLWSAVPAPVAATSEERIVSAVRRLAARVGQTSLPLPAGPA